MDCSTLGLSVHHQLPEFSQSHVHWRWSHPAISSSVLPFSSCLQSFPASGSFPMSQLSNQVARVLDFQLQLQWSWFIHLPRMNPLSHLPWMIHSFIHLPMNIQDWFPLGWTGWISLLSKRLSRVFSNTTVQKHQFFGAQLSLQFNSHIHTWPLEKP